MDYQRLREALRLRRKELGWTLDRLAQESGLDRATIHSIENLKREPNLKSKLETFEQLAAAMQLQLQIAVLRPPDELEQNTSPPLSGEADHVVAVPDAPPIDSLGLEIAVIGLTEALTTSTNRVVRHLERLATPRARTSQRRPRSDATRTKAS